jgi:hypothetical protein
VLYLFHGFSDDAAIETPGMHTWMVWRRNLAAFAPLLFQERSAPSRTEAPR